MVCCIITSLPCAVTHPALWFVALLPLFPALLATLHCGLLHYYLSSLCCYPPCIVVCCIITSLPCTVDYPALWFVALLPLFPALLATLHCGLLHYYLSSLCCYPPCIVVCCIITSLPCAVTHPALWFVALLHIFPALLATLHCGLLLDYLSSLCCYPPCIVVCSRITSLPCAVNHPALWFVAGLPLFPVLLATLHCGL